MAAVDRCQGALSPKADVGHRNRERYRGAEGEVGLRAIDDRPYKGTVGNRQDGAGGASRMPRPTGFAAQISLPCVRGGGTA